MSAKHLMNSLKNIKKYLKVNKIDVCLISKNNQYLNEFIEPRENFLQKITKFSGSLGYALISYNKKILYVDGRYSQQARIQSKIFTIKDISFLKKDLENLSINNRKLLIDPRTFSSNFINQFKFKNLVFFNSINNIRKKEKIFYLTKQYSGIDTIQKQKKLITKLKLKKNEAFLISSPENIAWLTNIRSSSKPFSKVFNCHALLNGMQIYIYSKQKVGLKLKNIIFKNEKEFEKDLSKIKTILFDEKYTSYYHYILLKNKNIKLKSINDPINLFKSIKNNTEISNLKIAHIFDGVAYCKFLYWIKNNKLKKVSEILCQKKIENLKKKNKFYLGPSFETISAVEKNASIIHYNANDFVKTYLKHGDLYLLDSGSQYFFGTTDMTRTIPLGNQNYFRKRMYTLVLKGHIAVSNANLKKQNGRTIDKMARFNLKKYGYNYNHSTGHGVGFLSNVHETPPSISIKSDNKFYCNQVVSNEPGFYENNKFGIRLENLIYVNNKVFFENLTLVPFEKSMILKSMLTKKEINWINNYHEEVYEKVQKFLNKNERKFLEEHCSKIY